MTTSMSQDFEFWPLLEVFQLWRKLLSLWLLNFFWCETWFHDFSYKTLKKFLWFHEFSLATTKYSVVCECFQFLFFSFLFFFFWKISVKSTYLLDLCCNLISRKKFWIGLDYMNITHLWNRKMCTMYIHFTK